MLRAIAHKKTRLHHRYLGIREEGEKHVREEDEITSNFFDGLAMLDARDVFAFWAQLTESGESSAFFPEGEPVGVDWRFWPRRWPGGKCIEPDMHLEFWWPNGERRSILVELKWRSGLGDNQLQDQWSRYLTDGERSTGIHVFIGKDVAPALAAQAEWDVWPSNRLLKRSWMDVRGAMQRVMPAIGPLSRWISLVDRFLESLQIARFSGFPDSARIVSAASSRAHVFWRGPEFLSGMCIPSGLQSRVLSKQDATPIFFSAQ